MDVFKRRDFARWQLREGMPDSALCQAVQEMEHGLVDAELGGCLFKKRVARRGTGKRCGYRVLLSVRFGGRYVFMLGFAKNDQADISHDERKALQYAGKVFLDLHGQHLMTAMQLGVLQELNCDEPSY